MGGWPGRWGKPSSAQMTAARRGWKSRPCNGKGTSISWAQIMAGRSLAMSSEVAFVSTEDGGRTWALEEPVIGP